MNKTSRLEIRLDAKQKAELRKFAIMEKAPISWVVRKAIDLYIKVNMRQTA